MGVFTDGEGREEIEKSIGTGFQQTAMPNTVRSFCWEIGELSFFKSPLLPAAIMPSPATVVVRSLENMEMNHKDMKEGFLKENSRCINLS